MSLDVLTVTLNPAIDWTVNIPDFTIGEVNRVASEREIAGGKGINVAAALADYGLDVAATGFLGRENDAPFRQLFEEKGIQDEMLRLPGATRTGIKIVGGTDGATTDINFPGLTPTEADLTALEYVLEQTETAWVVLAGSLPPGVSAHIYPNLARKVSGYGRKVALDTSGTALKLALNAAPDALPHLVKPNLDELEAWAGRKLNSPTEILEAARNLCQRGIEIVAVSMGAEGALLVTRKDEVMVIPPAIEVKSTVGAGDALVAGLVAASLRGLNLCESAQLATAFSLDVLSRQGHGVLTPEKVSEWSQQVEIRRAR